MKIARDVMTAHVVTISPNAIVKTATILMKGHEIGALPVVYDHEALMGIVYYHDLLGRDLQVNVSDVMSKEFIAISPDTPVVEAAEKMAKTGHSHLLVVEEGELIGIMSHSDVLEELGVSFDPLTGLPWSDALRDWATSALKRGHEIAVILIDLNQFGQFNKVYGHVTGDSVLKAVSESLKSGVDADVDFLCRYGGDEFALASVRHADDAIRLVESLVHRILELEITGIPEGVSATYGIAGGRRTKERLDVHYAATLDDLINRASQNCIQNKPGQSGLDQPVEASSMTSGYRRSPAAVDGGRLKLERISFASSGTEVTVDVILSRGDQEFVRSATGYAAATRNIVRLVAEATAAAVSSALAPGYGVVVDDVLIQSSGSDTDVVTVLGVVLTPNSSSMHAGSAIIRHSDLYRAAASALLSAVNRSIGTAPAAQSESAGE